jgi:hypothetical protein
LSNCVFDSVTISGSVVNPSDVIRSLGIILDPSITLNKHVTKLVGTCYYYLRQLQSIRSSLTDDSCHALVRAMILSRLDYCNGLFGGAPDYIMDQMNSVLRAAARLVLRLPRLCHITEVMRDNLHWLDFPNRITFKLCVLAFRCQHGLAPRYLQQHCVPVDSYSGHQHLRSAGSGRLFIPSVNTVRCGLRAFAVTCPSAWNSLPTDLRTADISLPVFRKRLKTILFHR